MEKLAISQPRYLPAANYIERIMFSDLFVMLDNVQHQKRAFEHRNKIRTSNGTTWLSIPIDRKNSPTDKICDLLIYNNENWKENHLKNFKFNYARTPYYDEVFDLLKRFYNVEYETLNEAVKNMIEIIVEYLELEANMVWASNYNFNKKNDDLLVEITNFFEGDTYISGPNGRDYIDEEKFEEKDIDVQYHEYNHPIYEQVWGEFKEYMTIWDMMFYFGKDTVNKIQTGKLVEE